ncbi:hemerythrin domain-containing protein [Intrasporangium flavum]|uniref:hemerythrin domain-containing protein n=1 Tax=Intrasporangium flavum TaxID=1428657 RepID=UPI00096F633B|nr:hemerythrin domain-containing protein [Intrasporangium flavum]
MDITEVIAHQHEEQRRMFAMLEEWPRDDHEGLAAVWKRLEVLLEVHAEAEERYFYPELLRLGTGGADAESVDEEVEDAVHDHNEIRKAVRKVGRCRTGSDAWWTAVVDANVHNSDHMGEEERQDLADFRQRASLELRHEIAVQFLRYEAQRWADGITPRDKDPERYVDTKKPARATRTEKRAARSATKATRTGPARKAASKKASKEASEG